MNTAPVVEPEPPAPATSPPRRWNVRAVLMDVLVVLGWFVVVGVLCALLWSHLVDLPQVTKTDRIPTLTPEELTKQVNIDGWYFAIAGIGGLVSGIALLAWRRRDPLLMVVLVALGGGLAAWVMVRMGLAFGPEKELAALRGLPKGSHVHEQLKLHAPGVAWVWPVGALLGALIYLWVLRNPNDEES